MKKSTEQSAASILWVVGDEEVQRFVFEQHGIGYWSACFNIILEKHGLLSFDRADHTILSKPDVVSSYGMLIVCWLPDSFWRPDYIKTLLAFNGPVFVEGPLPPEFSREIGLKPTGRQMVEGVMTLTAYNDLNHFNDWLTTPDQKIKNSGIPIGYKKVYTLPSEPSRRELCFGNEHDRPLRIHDTLLSHLLAYKQRFDRFGFFYEDAKINLLAWLAWLEALDKMVPGKHREHYRNWLRGAIASLPDTREFEGDVQVLSLLGIVYTMVYNVLKRDTYQKIDGIIEQLYRQIEYAEKLPVKDCAWFLCFVSMLPLEIRKEQTADQAARNLTARLKAADTQFRSEVLWAAALASKNRKENNFKSIADALSEITGGIGQEPRTILKLFEQRPLWEILLFSGILMMCGLKEFGASLLDLCMQNTFEAREGFFKSAVVNAGNFEIGPAYQSMPWIAIGLLPHVQKIQIRCFNEQPDTYSSKQKKAWMAQSWFAENCRRDEADVIATLQHHTEKAPVLISRDNITVSTLQLLSFVVHYHTMHPLDEPFCDCPSLHVQLIESLLIKILLRKASKGDIGMPLIAPWPYGYRYCMTIRHDVDRIPDEETFSKLLEFETDNQLGVTWFWIPSRLDSDYMKRIANRGFENGLHALHSARKNEEISVVTSALPSGVQVYGESFHGGGGGDYWRGPSSVMAASAAGLHYTELSSNLPLWPVTGFPMMEKNGTIRLSRIVGLTHLCCVDEGARRRTMNLIAFKSIRQMVNSGAYLTVLNHPDINFEKLCRWVEQTPQKGRLNWSSARVAKWWRKTHERSNLDLGSIEKQEGKLILNPYFKCDTKEPICLRLLVDGASCSRVQIRHDDRSINANWNHSSVEGLPCIEIGLIPPKEENFQIEIHLG